VLVVLPAGYDSTQARLPVLEVLHGSPGRPEDLFTSYDLTGVMAASPPFIAVVPDGHGPVVAEGDFADTSRQKLGAALSDDLRHWVDTTYRSNGQWGVTGYSSGGYGAAYLASRPAAGYSRVCTMSGYFTAEDPAFKGEPRPVRDAASPLLHVAPTGPPTMLIVGNADKEGLTEARTYVAALNRVGQANNLVILPGAHDAAIWQPGLPRCISFLLHTTQPSS
jgi:dipeptidyl aminopeptidase/acylaminoacyl peptidase